MLLKARSYLLSFLLVVFLQNGGGSAGVGVKNKDFYEVNCCTARQIFLVHSSLLCSHTQTHTAKCGERLICNPSPREGN